jgi:hypothetical protein
MIFSPAPLREILFFQTVERSDIIIQPSQGVVE